MSDAASGSRVKWYYCQEDGSGAISATTPNFTPIRFNSSDLSRDTTQIESEEINPDRQREKARQGTYSLQGSIVANLSYGSHEDLMQAGFQGTWTTAPTDYTSATVAAANSGSTLTDTNATFLTDGFKVGDLVTVTGFTETGNNVTDAKITALTETVMTLGNETLTDEALGDSVTIAVSGDYLEVGSTERTFALLRRNTDTGVDILYRGCQINGFSLNLTLNASATLTFPIIGKSAEEYTVPVGATFDAATSTEMMVPTIGSMKDNATSLAFLSDYSVEFSNGMNPLFALFSRAAYGVENGVFTASGSMSGYQEDATLLGKFIDETETDHIVTLLDLAGNSYRVILPDVLYTQLSDPVSGPGAHIHTYTFTAGYDGVTTARIERIPA